MQQGPTDFDRIINQIIPKELVPKLREDQKQYGDNHRSLGPAGQFADIWRKIGPLKRALWEGKRLPREGVREICMDLVGHCLLTVAMLDGTAWEWPALDEHSPENTGIMLRPGVALTMSPRTVEQLGPEFIVFAQAYVGQMMQAWEDEQRPQP